MTKIGLLSDTHGTCPKEVYTFFKDVDLILHAGDIGSSDVLEELKHFKSTIAVFGNIDGFEIYSELKKIEVFTIEKMKIVLTHIGGYPNKYEKGIKELLEIEKPDIFICGHSHILKVMFDKRYNLLHINPGAAGRYGFHKVSTLVRFSIDNDKATDLEIMEYEK